MTARFDVSCCSDPPDPSPDVTWWRLRKVSDDTYSDFFVRTGIFGSPSVITYLYEPTTDECYYVNPADGTTTTMSGIELLRYEYIGSAGEPWTTRLCGLTPPCPEDCSECEAVTVTVTGGVLAGVGTMTRTGCEWNGSVTSGPPLPTGGDVHIWCEDNTWKMLITYEGTIYGEEDPPPPIEHYTTAELPASSCPISDEWVITFTDVGTTDVSTL